MLSAVLGILGLLVTPLVWLTGQMLKGKLSAAQQAALEDLLHRSLAYAEEWARNREKAGEKPTPAAKLAVARAFAVREAKRMSIQLPGGDMIGSMLHAKLGERR